MSRAIIVITIAMTPSLNAPGRSFPKDALQAADMFRPVKFRERPLPQPVDLGIPDPIDIGIHLRRAELLAVNLPRKSRSGFQNAILY